MLSIPHMIVVFIVVLVVFGPQKLPELARSLGKLMAEFRKASGDFKSAFEEEMRDLERQARIAELKKQAAEATAATREALKIPTDLNTLATPPASGTLPGVDQDAHVTDSPRIQPVSEAVARLDGPEGATEATNVDGGLSSGSETGPVEAATGLDQLTRPETVHETSPETAQSTAESTPSHDQQQPA
jgi:TatA/E family protein of Tat protein translocase